MKKIPSLFQRNYNGDRLVRPEMVPGTKWVLSGTGTPTRKFDGTCCLIRDGRLYKRYEVKKVGSRPLPLEFEPAGDIDHITGKIQGWLPVGDGPEDRWHMQAWRNQEVHLGALMGDHTFELCGPNVQGNPEREYLLSEWPGPAMHILIPHGRFLLGDAPMPQWFEGPEQVSGFYDEVREFLRISDIEGIVWWRDLNDPDCDKAKVKGKDFGFKRGGTA